VTHMISHFSYHWTESSSPTLKIMRYVLDYYLLHGLLTEVI
jgi:hypothetical protein